MKKYIPLCLVLSSILSLQLYAAEKPRRFVEFGVDLGGGLANNLTGVRDIMKKQVYLDMDALSRSIKDHGIDLNADIESAVFFNFNIGELWGFGISTGVEGSINGNIPKSFFTLLTEGNIHQHNFEGDFTIFGGIYTNTALDVHATFGKIRVGVIPALFVPLIYIPRSGINYGLYTDDNLSAHAKADIQIYSPFSLENPDPSVAMQGSGFDLSLQGEYALLPFLDLGGTLSHIPLGGAELKHKLQISTDTYEINGDKILEGEGLDIPDFELKREYTTGSYRVFRPLRFDVYALWRPLLVDFFSLRPNIGFTHVFGADIPPYFNAGLEVRLSVLRLLFFHVGTGYEESVWRHRLGFALNLRIFEVDLEAGLRSQDFEKSFNLQGASVKVGLRLGF
ncbi:MAG: hypothetical protein LBD93_06635 [Treponema sp.]|jgi:hypothetical protein|nr:hypothetical protein [Treponema sp.]